MVHLDADLCHFADPVPAARDAHGHLPLLHVGCGSLGLSFGADLGNTPVINFMARACGTRPQASALIIVSNKAAAVKVIGPEQPGNPAVAPGVELRKN